MYRKTIIRPTEHERDIKTSDDRKDKSRETFSCTIAKRLSERPLKNILWIDTREINIQREERHQN